MNMLKNIAMLSLIGVLAPINAYSLTIGLDTEFSGGANPAGFPAIFPTIEITAVDADTVDVLITSNLSGVEFLDEVLLNYGGANALTASFVSGQDATEGVFFGSNAFKADGAGYFDIKFDYAASNADPNRFTAGETSRFTLSVASGLLDPTDFNFLSTTSAKGSFVGAAHVQGIAPNGSLSGWVGGDGDGPTPPPPDPDPTVPEPTAVWMLGLGLLGLVGYKRRQCKLAA